MYVSARSSAAHGSCLSDLRKQYVYRGIAVLCALHDPVQIYHFHISSTVQAHRAPGALTCRMVSEGRLTPNEIVSNSDYDSIPRKPLYPSEP